MKYLAFLILVFSFSCYASESYFMCVDLEQDEQILLLKDVHDVNRFSFFHPIEKFIQYDIYFKRGSTEVKIFKVNMLEKTVILRTENMNIYEWINLEHNITCALNE